LLAGARSRTTSIAACQCVRVQLDGLDRLRGPALDHAAQPAHLRAQLERIVAQPAPWAARDARLNCRQFDDDPVASDSYRTWIEFLAQPASAWRLLRPNTYKELAWRLKPGGAFVTAKRLLNLFPYFLAFCITPVSEQLLKWRAYIVREAHALRCGRQMQVGSYRNDLNVPESSSLIDPL
jgi:hypothetical protein